MRSLLLKNLIPDKVRIPAYIVVIASFVTLLQMLMQAYLPSLYASLGLFIPLIVVNCIILGRAEAYPNTLDPDVIKLREHAEQTVNSNQQPAEQIWVTLRSLLTNVGGFISMEPAAAFLPFRNADGILPQASMTAPIFLMQSRHPESPGTPILLRL